MNKTCKVKVSCSESQFVKNLEAVVSISRFGTCSSHKFHEKRFIFKPFWQVDHRNSMKLTTRII